MKCQLNQKILKLIQLEEQKDNMFLFEFDQDRALSTRIVALSNQLKNMLDSEEITDFTVDDLLEYFQTYDVILDREDLYNMIKVPPLKNVIDNIQGDKVIFKGQESEKTELPSNPEMEKKTVKQMAKRAMKTN